MKREGGSEPTGNGKKVCFMPTPEVIDYMEGEIQLEENGSDLDPLAPHPDRSKRIQGDVYSDDDRHEVDEGDDLEDGQKKSATIAPPKIESDSSGEEVPAPLVDSEDEEKITPFNLRDEREEGQFDAEDNFQLKRDEEAYQDRWLEGISREEIKKAKAAEERRQKAIEEDQLVYSKAQLIASLVALLQPGETVTRALQRLNSKLPPRRIGQKNKASVLTPQQQQEHAKWRQEIEKISSLATRLIDAGLLDVYDIPRESL